MKVGTQTLQKKDMVQLVSRLGWVLCGADYMVAESKYQAFRDRTYNTRQDMRRVTYILLKRILIAYRNQDLMALGWCLW